MSERVTAAPKGGTSARPSEAVSNRATAGRVTEPEIRRFVEMFYARVRRDPELGPIFEARIGDAWAGHLERMVDFWSSVLLASGRFRGDPVGTHHRMTGLRSEHFDRWLSLFGDVLRELLPAPRAEDVLGRARRMRVVLDRGDVRSTPDASRRLTGIAKKRAVR